ncbi:PREDICTED: luciferin 4-monooxygenase-like [Nicrophorus vespilloides]|uniref:Luciferin 4-monooxygenase-like n=1 Tax=Nicrophorus vespilloides TaxID=110193 RepID=A0ABM1MNN2_NICVS|nr:PREDICTED: luciferin 4-monooxygenase-like [Nicrophorus vespilloides]
MIKSEFEFDENQTFLQVIIKKCTLFGSRPAFIDAETKEIITFEYLLHKAKKLSNIFGEIGIRKGDIVAICVENNIYYPIIFVACLYSGIILNCINNKSTLYELEHLLGMSKPRLIFSSESTYEMIKLIREKLTFIKSQINVTKRVDCISLMELLELNILEEAQPEDIDPMEHVAVIMNSSGTTGLPKAVQITHDNLKYIIGYVGSSKFIELNSNDVGISICPFYHLYGFIVFVSTLLTGTLSVVMSKFRRERYLELIETYHVTKLWLVPPIAIFLAKSPLVDNYKLDCLKSIICGAAALGIEIKNMVSKRLNVTVQQVFGMTELSGIVAIMPIVSIEELGGCIGKLCPGVIGMIKDVETDEILGPYQNGEICFKGNFVMKGYLNNAAANASILDDDKVLRTGDIGYYDENGYFFVMDRMKELIKYKAYQVSPTELEDIINSHDCIADCAVIGKPDENSGELAMALIVTKSNFHINEQQIIDYVAKHVSIDKQLHGGVIFVDEIPKSASGKILRKELKKYII